MLAPDCPAFYLSWPSALLQLATAKGENPDADDGPYLRRVIREQEEILGHPYAITEVAILHDVAVGCATWYIRPGTDDPRKLHLRVRKMTIRDRLFSATMKVSRLLTSRFITLLEAFQAWSRPPAEPPISRLRLDQIARIGETLARSLIPPLDQAPGAGFLLLSGLTTLPEYRGRGVGAALLERGCEMAEEDGVPVYLISTNAGRNLYERRGFGVLGECEVGDGEGVLDRKIVMRLDPKV